MIRLFQSLLALVTLLLLSWLASRANSAPWQESDPGWQSAPAEPVAAATPPLLPVRRCLAPGPQPGTHLQGQPFAYGYFGARAQPTAAFHGSYRGDWFQWSFRRAD
jgi:hypothetical protein